ncbi:MAG: hypothetical protein R3B48_12850 [Kofleriaceae bacterium]
MRRFTIFGDLRSRAAKVYRVTTHGSTYLLAIHERRGHKYAVVRGAPGGDREHVNVRDGDPRVGESSLFDVPPEQWVGQTLELATMTTSEIVSVEEADDPEAIAAVGGGDDGRRNRWGRPQGTGVALAPPGRLSASPAIHPSPSRGTLPSETPTAPTTVAHKIVVGAAVDPNATAAELPYPARHVRYAENVTAFLRAISARENLFEDLRWEHDLRDRLRRALDESARLLEAIRSRQR